MAITTETISDLMAIRALRDHAVRIGKSPGSTNRQIAVILLDAAIERAVFSAAEYLGDAFKNFDNADKALQALRNQGLSLKDGLETSRKRLHRARNLAQHASVGIDRDELPGWVAATERLVTQIIQFAFDIDIDSLRYSETIEDLEVRRLLDLAEDFLKEHNRAAAMSHVEKAYLYVFESWRKFAVASQSGLESRPTHTDSLGIRRGDDPMAAALRHVTLLTSISQDAGEAIWFLEAKRNQSLLTEEEVQRALAFVVAFAVTIEATPAARRVDRRVRSNRLERLVRFKDDKIPSIAQGAVTQYATRTALKFVIKDVPDVNEFDEWSEVVQAELHRSVHGRNSRVYPNGTIQISTVDDFPAQIELIERTLSNSLDLVQKKRDNEVREEQELHKARQSIQTRIDALVAGGVPGWLSFRVGTDIHRAANPHFVEIRISHPRAGEVEVGEILQSFGQQVYVVDRTKWRLRPFNADRIHEAIKTIEEALEVASAAFDDAREQEAHNLKPLVTLLQSRGYLERECID